MTTWFPEGYPTRPKVFYPPGPLPLSAATANPKPPTWRASSHTNASGTGSGSSRTGTGTSSKRSEPRPSPLIRPNATELRTRIDTSDSSYLRAHPQSDLVEGVDYFKIGDGVRVRRWAAKTDSFTSWIIGQVVRPMLVENEDGSQRRSYLVAYEDPRTKERKEKQFSPHYREIAAVESDPEPLVPNRSRVDDKRAVVLAPIPMETINGRIYIYTPCRVLTAPNEQGSVRLRVLSGPSANREISSFTLKYAPAYTKDNVKILQQRGLHVEVDSSNWKF